VCPDGLTKPIFSLDCRTARPQRGNPDDKVEGKVGDEVSLMQPNPLIHSPSIQLICQRLLA